MSSKVKIDLKVACHASYIIVVMALTACQPYVETVNTGGGQSVTERGVLDPTQAWPGSGNYTAFDESTLTASKVCSDKSIFGEAGTAVCQVGTATDAAIEANVLLGKEFFDGSGALLTGTAVDHGTVNLNTSAIPNSGGFFSSIVLSLTTSDVCVGKSIFGSLGSAACGLASRAHRNIGSATERARPLVNKDHDGFYPGGGGNDPNAAANLANQITKADTSGIVSSCGIAQDTVAARILDCNYSWDGTTYGNSGEGKWSLVTKNISAGKEVWRDDRTGMLWSDNLTTANWCQAAGNIENSGDDSQGWTIDCSPGAGSGLQPATPISLCAEDTGFNSNDYDDAKGGMRLTAVPGTSPSVSWRLPTRSDMLQAYTNGAGYVMNVFRDGNGYWTASVVSAYRTYAWVFGAYVGGYMSLGYVGRAYGFSVRCVGR